MITTSKKVEERTEDHLLQSTKTAMQNIARKKTTWKTLTLTTPLTGLVLSALISALVAVWMLRHADDMSLHGPPIDLGYEIKASQALHENGRTFMRSEDEHLRLFVDAQNRLILLNQTVNRTTENVVLANPNYIKGNRITLDALVHAGTNNGYCGLVWSTIKPHAATAKSVKAHLLWESDPFHHACPGVTLHLSDRGQLTIRKYGTITATLWSADGGGGLLAVDQWSTIRTQYDPIIGAHLVLTNGRQFKISVIEPGSRQRAWSLFQLNGATSTDALEYQHATEDWNQTSVFGRDVVDIDDVRVHMTSLNRQHGVEPLPTAEQSKAHLLWRTFERHREDQNNRTKNTVAKLKLADLIYRTKRVQRGRTQLGRQGGERCAELTDLTTSTSAFSLVVPQLATFVALLLACLYVTIIYVISTVDIFSHSVTASIRSCALNDLLAFLCQLFYADVFSIAELVQIRHLILGPTSWVRTLFFIVVAHTVIGSITSVLHLAMIALDRLPLISVELMINQPERTVGQSRALNLFCWLAPTLMLYATPFSYSVRFTDVRIIAFMGLCPFEAQLEIHSIDEFGAAVGSVDWSVYQETDYFAFIYVKPLINSNKHAFATLLIMAVIPLCLITVIYGMLIVLLASQSLKRTVGERLHAHFDLSGRVMLYVIIVFSTTGYLVYLLIFKAMLGVSYSNINNVKIVLYLFSVMNPLILIVMSSSLRHHWLKLIFGAVRVADADVNLHKRLQKQFPNLIQPPLANLQPLVQLALASNLQLPQLPQLPQLTKPTEDRRRFKRNSKVQPTVFTIE